MLVEVEEMRGRCRRSFLALEEARERPQFYFCLLLLLLLLLPLLLRLLGDVGTAVERLRLHIRLSTPLPPLIFRHDIRFAATTRRFSAARKCYSGLANPLSSENAQQQASYCRQDHGQALLGAASVWNPYKVLPRLPYML